MSSLGLSADEANAEGDRHMLLAKTAFAKAETLHVRLEATAIDIARAQYFQTRALSFYQYAANAAVRQ